jgi:hypothetical protein
MRKSNRHQSGVSRTTESPEVVSRQIVIGTEPVETPVALVEFDELYKKSIDNLTEILKYIATTSGIVIAMYSAAVREYIKDPFIASHRLARILVFTPVLLLVATIVCTVLGVFPKSYIAKSDYEKSIAVKTLRVSKRRWGKAALIFFLAGFIFLLYVIGAQAIGFYPFT